MPGRSRWENPRDGDPTASPHRHSSSHIPPSQKCPHAAAHRAPQTALLCPLEAIPKDRGFILLILGNPAAKPRMGLWLLQRRRITGKMIPGHAGRCHIIKQALFLSSQHPGPTQVRLSGHRVLGRLSCEALGPLFSLQG